MTVREEAVRAPQQERAKRRVENILGAVRVLIADKGWAGVKMGDVAATANVTAASIYQYFPNKRAIMAALAQQYLDTTRQTVDEALAERPRDLDDLQARFDAIVDEHYHQVRRDLVVQSVWARLAADKELQAMDASGTEAMAELIFERAKHLFRRDRRPQIRTSLRLLIELAGAAIALAVTEPSARARRTMTTAHTMLQASWQAALVVHAAP